MGRRIILDCRIAKEAMPAFARGGSGGSLCAFVNSASTSLIIACEVFEIVCGEGRKVNPASRTAAWAQ